MDELNYRFGAPRKDQRRSPRAKHHFDLASHGQMEVFCDRTRSHPRTTFYWRCLIARQSGAARGWGREAVV